MSRTNLEGGTHDWLHKMSSTSLAIGGTHDDTENEWKFKVPFEFMHYHRFDTMQIRRMTLVLIPLSSEYTTIHPLEDNRCTDLLESMTIFPESPKIVLSSMLISIFTQLRASRNQVFRNSNQIKFDLGAEYIFTGALHRELITSPQPFGSLITNVPIDGCELQIDFETELWKTWNSPQHSFRYIYRFPQMVFSHISCDTARQCLGFSMFRTTFRTKFVILAWLNYAAADDDFLKINGLTWQEYSERYADYNPGEYVPFGVWIYPFTWKKIEDDVSIAPLEFSFSTEPKYTDYQAPNVVGIQFLHISTNDLLGEAQSLPSSTCTPPTVKALPKSTTLSSTK